jgi:hypothetical protein
MRRCVQNMCLEFACHERLSSRHGWGPPWSHLSTEANTHLGAPKQITQALLEGSE